MKLENISAYEVIEQSDLKDIESEGILLRHKKTGARIAVVSNNDDNKVFYIGFRTPPEDYTGVPHIIEHTTLCGSEKFPVKDPFVELVKGSLNTFLNAMTYPDKTLYPVASYNDKDFKNLMDVYLDAVFHPNITKYEEIFKQEGWHYELEDKDAPLTINGVVYNEMKGAYSAPEEIQQQAISASLFPDNTYSKDSGGNPDYIPTLTYEAYLEFYHKYYHPSNSYIYLYGDMDVEERLNWMDQEYLSKYDYLEVDSEVKKQEAFSQVKEVVTYYPITDAESEKDNTYLSYNKVVGDVLDKKLYQAFDILDYVLVSAPGAPVRQALLDAGVGKDISCSYTNGIYQPTFSITAKNANLEDKDKFVSIIEDTLRDLVKNGLNQKSLLAGINSEEFRFREGDCGHYPKGLLYGLSCMDSWLYDENKPFLHIECLDTYAFLKEQISTGYFEGLVEEYLLNNTHGSIIAVTPKKNLNQENEQRLQEKLEAYKKSLSEEEIEALIAETKHLHEYQMEPSPEEELEKIPMLTREDLKKEALEFSNIEVQLGEVPVVRHEVATNGIDYITFLFKADDVAEEDIPYFGVLRAVLGYMDTESYSFSELAN
ncbi:MAG: insulinase family protein, partial [Agathobacter sp.]|nr:insulinase family protein [Agathobacter sp.]